MANGNKPEKTFRLGLVSASVFANAREGASATDERVQRSVQLQRRYRDAKGEWQSSTSFDVGSLPAAIEALRLALAYVVQCDASPAAEPSF